MRFQIKSLSEVNFVAPYKFIGLEALSVDKATTFLTFSMQASIMFIAPKRLSSHTQKDYTQQLEQFLWQQHALHNQLHPMPDITGLYLLHRQ